MAKEIQPLPHVNEMLDLELNHTNEYKRIV